MTGGVVSPSRLVMTQVFHPGTTEVGRAARLSVRAGEERAGIDVPLQYVAMATVSGSLEPIPGTHPSVTLARLGEVAGAEAIRVTHPDADGRFTFVSIPPGQYLLIARSIASSPPTPAGSPQVAPPAPIQTSTAEVTVDGEDVTGVALSPLSLVTISGRLAFEGARPAPDLGAMRLPFNFAGLTIGNFQAQLPQIQLETGGRFIVAGILPGLYRMGALSSQAIQGIRAPIGGWWLKSHRHQRPRHSRRAAGSPSGAPTMRSRRSRIGPAKSPAPSGTRRGRRCADGFVVACSAPIAPRGSSTRGGSPAFAPTRGPLRDPQPAARRIPHRRHRRPRAGRVVRPGRPRAPASRPPHNSSSQVPRSRRST